MRCGIILFLILLCVIFNWIYMSIKLIVDIQNRITESYSSEDMLRSGLVYLSG